MEDKKYKKYSQIIAELLHFERINDYCNLTTSERSGFTDTILDGLQKQMPMKVGRSGVCGNCETFGVKSGNAYCYNCGQKVDWNE